ncbi:MAG TPA: flagellar protein FlaG [Lachnospiraceae bacterium]|nr:flagellar protein FlaG [Lachnospiraceae bacterium]
MAIESLNSALSFQAQPVQKIVPTVEKTTEGNVQNLEKNIDVKNLAVSSTDGKSEDQGIETKDQQPTTDQLRKAIEHINKNTNNSEVLFGIHEGTNRITIKIVDRTTKELIKELPPEKTLDMIAKAWELAGILVDEKR